MSSSNFGWSAASDGAVLWSAEHTDELLSQLDGDIDLNTITEELMSGCVSPPPNSYAFPHPTSAIWSTLASESEDIARSTRSPRTAGASASSTRTPVRPVSAHPYMPFDPSPMRSHSAFPILEEQDSLAVRMARMYTDDEARLPISPMKNLSLHSPSSDRHHHLQQRQQHHHHLRSNGGAAEPGSPTFAQLPQCDVIYSHPVRPIPGCTAPETLEAMRSMSAPIFQPTTASLFAARPASGFQQQQHQHHQLDSSLSMATPNIMANASSSAFVPIGSDMDESIYISSSPITVGLQSPDSMPHSPPEREHMDEDEGLLASVMTGSPEETRRTMYPTASMPNLFSTPRMRQDAWMSPEEQELHAVSEGLAMGFHPGHNIVPPPMSPQTVVERSSPVKNLARGRSSPRKLSATTGRGHGRSKSFTTSCSADLPTDSPKPHRRSVAAASATSSTATRSPARRSASAITVSGTATRSSATRSSSGRSTPRTRSGGRSTPRLGTSTPSRRRAEAQAATAANGGRLQREAYNPYHTDTDKHKPHPACQHRDAMAMEDLLQGLYWTLNQSTGQYEQRQIRGDDGNAYVRTPHVEETPRGVNNLMQLHMTQAFKTAALKGRPLLTPITAGASTINPVVRLVTSAKLFCGRFFNDDGSCQTKECVLIQMPMYHRTTRLQVKLCEPKGDAGDYKNKDVKVHFVSYVFWLFGLWGGSLTHWPDSLEGHCCNARAKQGDGFNGHRSDDDFCNSEFVCINPFHYQPKHSHKRLEAEITSNLARCLKDDPVLAGEAPSAANDSASRCYCAACKK